MDLSKKVFEKAQDVLFFDKIQAPKELSQIVASEIFYVLSQYFEISPQDYKTKIFVQKNGSINIDFSFVATRMLVKR